MSQVQGVRQHEPFAAHYAYDADDNIIRINDTVDATKTPQYVYDEAGRLTRLDTASGPIQRTNFTYDRTATDRAHCFGPSTDAHPLETDVYSYEPGTNHLAAID